MKETNVVKTLYDLRRKIYKLQQMENELSERCTKYLEKHKHLKNGDWEAIIDVIMIRRPSWKDELYKLIGSKGVEKILNKTLATPSKKLSIMYKGKVKNGFHTETNLNEKEKK